MVGGLVMLSASIMWMVYHRIASGTWSLHVVAFGHVFDFGSGPKEAPSLADLVKTRYPDVKLVRSLTDSRAAFEKYDGTWGYVDQNGKIIIPAIYSMVWDFNEGIAIVQHDSASGMIDQSGGYLTELDPQIDVIESLGGRRFRIKYIDGRILDFDAKQTKIVNHATTSPASGP